MTTVSILDELEPAQDAKASLTQKAYRRIEELIVTLRLKPGEVLSETALADQLNIGRTPIREALQALGREGLVVILPRRGILVSELDVQRQLKLLEVRRELERLMARKAARRARPDEKAAFIEIAEGMRGAASNADELAFMRYDRHLNLLLCRAARNEFLENAMALTHGLSRRFWFQHHKEVGDLPLCATLHADSSEAAGRGREQDAAEASDRLLDYVESFTRKTLDTLG